MSLQIKRVYESPAPTDGTRVLVDRLWPRGLTKAKARINLWLKDIAPSTTLRQWFRHDPAKWHEFTRRYLLELGQNHRPVSTLLELQAHGKVTLVYGARDQGRNDAVVLKDYLQTLS